LLGCRLLLLMHLSAVHGAEPTTLRRGRLLSE
jgi:hypothetical protein